VVVDAQHRALVNEAGNHPSASTLSPRTRGIEEASMGKGILLWLLGVPIPVIILLWLFFGH
jgi:hypothetical protein